MLDSRTEEAKRRYPGVRSFEEQDRIQFFGRRRAAEELLLRVLSVRLLLQFAPSGVGKTSLLNAGLFPRLLPHDYFPFIVRLNQPAESLAAAVWRSLHEAAVARGLKDPVVPSNAQTVWELLAGAQLWSDALRSLTPVLVFDQFEEIFTLRDEAFRRQFATEIGELLRGSSTRASVPAPSAKIIISLREEYLGKLEEFSDSIPELFHERLRLPPLTSEEAREAIVEPAKLRGEWLSPTFAFDAECIDALIDFIDGTSERTRMIEPLTLQLVCQQAESIVISRGDESMVLALQDFGGVAGLERLVKNYFDSELAKLGARGVQSRAREMFEDGLLDPTGKRLMLEQDEIKRTYGVNEADLGKLVESRLLRREPRNDSIFYEIGHDRLAETIGKNRKTRLPRWAKWTIGVGAGAIAVLTFFVIVVLILQQRATEERERADDALQLVLGEDLVSRLREGGQSEALRRVLDNVKLGESTHPLTRALKLRHEGDVIKERGTLHEAYAKFTEALDALTLAEAEQGKKNKLEIKAERARVLHRLAMLATDLGELKRAEEMFAESIGLWEEVLVPSRSVPRERLDAAESRIERGLLFVRLGDSHAAEAEYAQARSLTLQVVSSAYGQTQGGGHEKLFDLGRATQVYADAALDLALIYGDPLQLTGAYALAKEALRLRPLSYRARFQVGAANLERANALFANSNAGELDAAANESRQRIEELIQFDPENRRLQRDLAMVQSRIDYAQALCAEADKCRAGLGAATLREAEMSSLDSLGTFRYLAQLDPANRSLQFDIASALWTNGKILGVTGRRSEALDRLEEARRLTAANIVDARDVEKRVNISDLFIEMARIQAGAGDLEAANTQFDKALAEIDQLPDGLRRKIARASVLAEKANVVPKESTEHEQVQAEVERLLREIGTPWRQGRTDARGLNEQAVALHKQARAGQLDDWNRALDLERQAVDAYPFEDVYWSNMRIFYADVATTIADLPVSGDPSAQRRDQRSVLSASLAAAWMSNVLRPEARAAKTWQALYESRRSLALYLRDQPSAEDVRRSLALAMENVTDAKRYDASRGSSSETVDRLADAYVGLGVMRGESGSDGWSEPLQVALAYLNRLVETDPKNPNYHFRLADIHYLNHRFELTDRAQAEREHALMLETCRKAILVSGKPRSQQTSDSPCLEQLDVADKK